MQKKYSLLGLFIVVLFIICLIQPYLSLNTITGLFFQEQPQEIPSYIQDEGNISVFFCPQEDCEGNLVQFLDSAQESIHCALFEINLVSVQQKLLEKSTQMDVKVVTDNDYLKEFNHSFVKADSWGLMHNKFCIIDGKKVSSGSMNPTNNCAHKNNNNLLLINSEVLANNYEEEFQEMWNGTFKKGQKVRNSQIKLGDTFIQNYFCPEDNCGEKVKAELKKAEKSIYFMQFSFTHESIANALLLKNLDNVTIKGVMETQQISPDSKFKVMQAQGIDVWKDGNKYKLHHKVWIIDERCVVTGSFNPSASGDSRNDENVLIICNSEIVAQFVQEFWKIYSQASNLTQYS